MKRVLVLLGTVILCSVQFGCGSDPREEAIKGVVTQMDTAAAETKAIAEAIDKAIETTSKQKTPLDLADAIKAAKRLEDTGKKVQNIKVGVDNVAPATKEEKEQYAADPAIRSRINNAYSELVKNKALLNEKLKKADDVDKEKTDELRKKIGEAEAPFEALARQLG